MSQIFQAFPPLQILPLHCFNPISFDLILFPKPTLSSPVQIWKIPEDLRLEDTPNPNSNRDVICAYKVFTEVDSRPCSSEIGTLHPQRFIIVLTQHLVTQERSHARTHTEEPVLFSTHSYTSNCWQHCDR
ncbi:hypothetical protein HanXRQr2_Chr10g0439511 [Helianthus annuus]|uniref:Uncharacterized protein n=1 Tax=Helianthus annuus TaxID=4232 RepID=A0A251TIZ2_HELAN|nr:uncharacterized protein LOC110885115 isoform X1 [Helianthus annuus]KAF5786321.1 hypothetical protein HanXRQr2_Chr10g0439511 [Helianthus annuus]